QDHHAATAAIGDRAPDRREDRQHNGLPEAADAGPDLDLLNVADAELSDVQRQEGGHESEGGEHQEAAAGRAYRVRCQDGGAVPPDRSALCSLVRTANRSTERLPEVAGCAAEPPPGTRQGVTRASRERHIGVTPASRGGAGVT